MRAKRLGQTDTQPMAVFINKAGTKKYDTGNKISDVLRAAAKHVHPDLTEQKMSLKGSHRVLEVFGLWFYLMKLG